jgi:hypothetical protein
MNLHRRSIDVFQTPIIGLLPASISLFLAETPMVLEETIAPIVQPVPVVFAFSGFTLSESYRQGIFQRIGDWSTCVLRMLHRFVQYLKVKVS